jgi:hypothetical protein
LRQRFRAGIAQLVERNLAKVEVAGSNPVSRSNLQAGIYKQESTISEARWQSGYAADCKSVNAGSIPTRASNFPERSMSYRNFIIYPANNPPKIKRSIFGVAKSKLSHAPDV